MAIHPCKYSDRIKMKTTYSSWKDISKKFRTYFPKDNAGTIRYIEAKSFLHSTLDEYVKELIGPNEPDTYGEDSRVIKAAWTDGRNELRQELLQQHEENLK